MLKDRGELEKKLIIYITNNITNRNKMSERQQWGLELYSKYGIPVSMSSDIIGGRKDLSEYNTFVLFAITDIIKPEWIEQYYSPQEIKMFNGQQYDVEPIKFPIKLHLIKITDDQYIGRTTAQFLMKLRAEQLINYNADTQRALRIMVKGGTIILRPFLNSKAVNEIDESYATGTFIPNMITLNINQDDENADYVYDEKEEILTINNITAFDIADGYHRYLGLSRNYDRDNNWDYPMMLQISTFSVGKAKQMIFQEDQKTQMKKIDSFTYNQYNSGNMVVTRLNSDNNCNLSGLINITDGIVDAGILAKAIDRLYFQKKNVERKEIINTAKLLRSELNYFTEEHSEYLERKWEPYEILAIVYGLFNEYEPDQIVDAISHLSKENRDYINLRKDFYVRVLGILKEVY